MCAHQLMLARSAYQTVLPWQMSLLSPQADELLCFITQCYWRQHPAHSRHGHSGQTTRTAGLWARVLHGSTGPIPL